MSSNIVKIVDSVRDAFYTKQKPKSYEWRLQQLQQLRKMVANEEARWHEAMHKDLRSTELLKLIETKSCLGDIDGAISNLWDWMKPKPRSNTQIANIPGSAYLLPEPYGLVLIISPWNYPIQLLIRPLVGAIAAGNAAIIKPSEVSENVSKLFTELTPKYLDQEYIRCIEGGVPETTALLAQKWDYIFYTGSTMVGKLVMKAATEHLTPVTLELGGKSPCIVDKSASMDVAIRRITWGKLLNCGQSCIAPDYALVHKDVEEEFVKRLKAQIEEFYGKDIKGNKYISRIISERHTQRIQKLIESAKDNVVFGGEVDVKDKFVSPTLIKAPKEDSLVMKEEIFGPILPYYTVNSIDEAVSFINKREKPLALYIMATDKKVQDKVLNATSSGTVCVNDTMLQFTVPDLPFGGVGPSGMGSYNGKSSFDTFTHLKSVFDRPNFIDLPLRYPPYTNGKVTILKHALGKSLPQFSQVLKFAIPLLVVIGGIIIYSYNKSKL